jgi:hypothetical protein
MANSKLSALSVHPVNKAEEYDPFDPIDDAQGYAWALADERGDARIEWRHDSSGRCVGGDPRLPREWLPYLELVAAIRAVPLPETTRRGWAVVKAQLGKRKKIPDDCNFGQWQAFTREWGFALEGTRAGWLRLRVSPAPAWWKVPDPYQPLEPVGTTVYRTKDIRTLRDYLGKLAVAELATCQARVKA